jgi:hypothetical protein
MPHTARLRSSAPPPRGGALVLLPGLVCDRAAWEPTVALRGAIVDCRDLESGPDWSLGAMAERVLAAAPATLALVAADGRAHSPTPSNRL